MLQRKKITKMFHKYCIDFASTIIRRRWSNHMWHVCFTQSYSMHAKWQDLRQESLPNYCKNLRAVFAPAEGPIESPPYLLPPARLVSHETWACTHDTKKRRRRRPGAGGEGEGRRWGGADVAQETGSYEHVAASVGKETSGHWGWRHRTGAEFVWNNIQGMNTSWDAESVMKIGNKVTPYLLSERQIRLKQCIHQIWKLTNVDVHHCRCSSNVDIE